MDLVRRILIKMEESSRPHAPYDFGIDGVPPELMSYHVMLMSQAGLLEANDMTSSSGFEWQPIMLTWSGHEFLDSVRDNAVWSKTMAAVSQVAGSVSFEVLKQIVSRVAMQSMGLPAA